MENINLEYYRAFYYVAQCRSVTKAAEKLCISQPSVTYSIKKLESHLGKRLFRRSSRGMELTHEGDILFGYVSRAYQALKDAGKEISEMSVSGTLSIGATETGLHHFLLPVIEKFTADYPSVHFSIAGNNTPDLIDALSEGTIELAVAVSPVELPPDLTFITVADFSDIVIAGSRFAELKNRLIEPAELVKYPIVTVEKTTSARNQIDIFFENNNAALKPAYTVRTSSLVLPFVERNLALGILPDMFAREAVDSGRVFKVRMSPGIPGRQILIIFPKDEKDMSELSRMFIRYVKG